MPAAKFAESAVLMLDDEGKSFADVPDWSGSIPMGAQEVVALRVSNVNSIWRYAAILSNVPVSSL